MAEVASASANIPDDNRVAFGVGTYGGESAVALDYSHSMTRHVNVSLGAAYSDGDAQAGAAIGFGW